MSKSVSVMLLFGSRSAGGERRLLVRRGIHSLSWQRVGWFAIGGVVLFVYGWTVNRPPWNFGELLGL